MRVVEAVELSWSDSPSPSSRLNDRVEPGVTFVAFASACSIALVSGISLALRVVRAVNIALIALRSSRAVAISSLELARLFVDRLAPVAGHVFERIKHRSPSTCERQLQAESGVNGW